jgi:hypothetical protein
MLRVRCAPCRCRNFCSSSPRPDVSATIVGVACSDAVSHSNSTGIGWLTNRWSSVRNAVCQQKLPEQQQLQVKRQQLSAEQLLSEQQLLKQELCTEQPPGVHKLFEGQLPGQQLSVERTSNHQLSAKLLPKQQLIEGELPKLQLSAEKVLAEQQPIAEQMSEQELFAEQLLERHQVEVGPATVTMCKISGDSSASDQASSEREAPRAALTHVGPDGRANMVNVSHKADTHRVAVAVGSIFLGRQQKCVPSVRVFTIFLIKVLLNVKEYGTVP